MQHLNLAIVQQVNLVMAQNNIEKNLFQFNKRKVTWQLQMKD